MCIRDRIQIVEHLAPECIWTDPWLDHDNGVVALDAVFVVAEDPVATAARWAEFSGLLPRRDGEAIRLETDRGEIVIATRAALAAQLGVAAAQAVAGGLGVQPCAQGFAVQLPPELGGAWRLR